MSIALRSAILPIGCSTNQSCFSLPKYLPCSMPSPPLLVKPLERDCRWVTAETRVCRLGAIRGVDTNHPPPRLERLLCLKPQAWSLVCALVQCPQPLILYHQSLLRTTHRTSHRQNHRSALSHVRTQR